MTMAGLVGVVTGVGIRRKKSGCQYPIVGEERKGTPIEE